MAEGNGDRLVGAWVRGQAAQLAPWAIRGVFVLIGWAIWGAFNHFADRFTGVERAVRDISAVVSEQTHQLDRRLAIEELRSAETAGTLRDHNRRIGVLEYIRQSPAGPIPTMPRQGDNP